MKGLPRGLDGPLSIWDGLGVLMALAVLTGFLSGLYF
jgi:hypothetical protein